MLTHLPCCSPPPPPGVPACLQVRSLDPCTHAYSFWEGVPIDGKAAFGALFAASRTLRSVAVVQRAIRWAACVWRWRLSTGGVGWGLSAAVCCVCCSLSRQRWCSARLLIDVRHVRVGGWRFSPCRPPLQMGTRF